MHIFCAAILVVFSAARAQEPSARTQIPEQVDLARLVDLCAQRLRRNIQYDPSVLKGSVTLRQGAGLSDTELWTLTNRLLATAGFTTVQLAGESTLSVVRLSDAPIFARMEVDLRDAQAGFLRVVRTLRYKSAKEVSDSLTPLLSKPGGSVTALDGGKRVLLADLHPQLDQALAALDWLDTPSVSAATLGLFEASHLRATDLVTLVDRVQQSAALGGKEASSASKLLAGADEKRILILATDAERDRMTALLTALDQAPAITTATYRSASFGVREVAKLIEDAVHAGSPNDPWRLVVDELTGSLLISASASQHAQIATLLERLEASGSRERRPLRSYPVRNRSVSEVVEVLGRILDGGALDTGKGSPNAMTSVGGAPTAPSSAGIAPASTSATASNATKTGLGPDALTITADVGTNTLIAVGESRLLEQLSELLSKIDVLQPQVLLEARLVSLSDSDVEQLGFELQRLQLARESQIAIASLFGLGSPAVAGPLPPSSGSGFSGVLLNPGDFTALARALETVSQGRSVSAPKVLVANHQQARLDATLQQPYLSTNASNTVATTSFGGSLDAGTVITVKPQITEADHLLLDYTITLSSFVGTSASPQLPPPRQQSSLQSQVTIPDGFTVAVGGLDVTQDSVASSQVPILGDIPILGALFRSTTTTKSRTRFFVFLRASVMGDGAFERLRFRSDLDREEAAVTDDGTPTLEPVLMR